MTRRRRLTARSRSSGSSSEIDARLHLAPTFRRRLTELPGGLHMPYWVDDPNFDLEYHVRHIALPQPGDWRQLCIQIARLHGRQLDLRRPPWEMTVIEGLNSIPGVPKGSFAISLKLHHCVVDGMESVELMAAMHDLALDSPRPAAPEKPFEPGALPSTSDLVARTATNIALYPLRASKVLIPNAVKAIRHLHTLPGALVSGVASALAPGSGSMFAPATRFNGSATPHRVFEARFHDLADFKRIKGCVPKATINDVTLAYVGGALRHYLEGHGELPDESLVAACPASIRSTRRARCGWQPTLRQIASVGHLDRRPAGTPGGDRRRDLGLPRQRRFRGRLSVDGPGGRGAHHAARADREGRHRHAVLRADHREHHGEQRAGPTEPIYFAGARLQRVTGLGPLIGGMNLFHVVASYNGTISIGATADRSALPDPGHYADCMQTSFEEMLSAAG